METKVATNAEELRAIMADYRQRIQRTKTLDEDYRKMYWPWFPEAWEAVDEALKVRARYWRGEIIRAKHNLAHYMRGEDLELQHRHIVQNMESDWFKQELDWLQNSIAICEENRQPIELARSDLEYYRLQCRDMKADAKHTERYIYGG